MTYEQFEKKFKEEIAKLTQSELETYALLGLWMIKRVEEKLIKVIDPDEQKGNRAN